MKGKEISTDHQKKLEAVSSFLREYRINSGISRKELSGFTNLHLNTIARAEHSKNISLLNLIKIAENLDVSWKEIFFEID
jgi:transcriptional regulator with XRE-family HTH domain